LWDDRRIDAAADGHVGLDGLQRLAPAALEQRDSCGDTGARIGEGFEQSFDGGFGVFTRCGGDLTHGFWPSAWVAALAWLEGSWSCHLVKPVCRDSCGAPFIADSMGWQELSTAMVEWL